MFTRPRVHIEAPFGAAVFAAQTHCDIAERAFDIFVKKGRKHGQCEQNGCQAKHDLQNQRMVPRAT